jgi:hypothetical protein
LKNYYATFRSCIRGPACATSIPFKHISVNAEGIELVGQQIFSRIPINSDGTPAGPAEVIANIFGDDFSFDSEGNAYIGQSVNNTVAKVAPDGVVTIVAGSLNSTEIATATDWER